MKEIRQSILSEEFDKFKKEFLSKYNSSDRQAQVRQKMMWVESQKRKGRYKI